MALVSGCGDDRSAKTDARSGKVAAVLKPLDDPFFATMRDGLVAAAHNRRLPISVEAAVGLQDTAGQAAALASLADERAACYVLNPIDPTNLVQSLPAIGGGTPIVNVESPINRAAAKAVGSRITAYIGTDNVAAGRLAADAMADLVPRGARVVVIAGIPGDAGSSARVQGFMEGARGRFEVVQTVAADFDRTQANMAAAQLLGARPSVDGFFAVNDEMALGVAAAVSAAGKSGEVPVVGTDGIAEALAAIKRGAMAATVARYPFTIGRLGVEACLAAIRGKPVPAEVKTPIQLVTRRNVARALLSRRAPPERFDDPLLRVLSG
jgi:ABC-type sugar transport system substrate-binding protein